ncbi:DUF742 domain-containing protein [Streptacidiphilus sp. EB103A]|uniref:DUF742 domain-containing protein n=1 Tax=Streptacidiphilus sp. EB103A TaxID=3156275 RepID=UPI0035134894
MTLRRQAPRTVPAYLATQGRSSTHRNTFDQLTRLLRSGNYVPRGLDPPHHRLLDLLAGGTLTLADAAAHLRLPVSVLRVLAGDLLDQSLIEAIPPAALPPVDLLERLLDGLIKARDREPVQ